jgi:archaellum component FlaG (FlaF/FlaG flagellin family)
MGFSTIAAQLMFFIAVVGLSAGMIAVFGNYLNQAQGAMSDKQQHIVEQLRTDLVITSIDNSSGHIYVYVKNVGKEQMKTDCVNLFIDGSWVNLGEAIIVDPSTGSAATLWAPQDTIELKPLTAPLNSQAVHEAKVITCNGVSDAKSF